MADYTPTTRLHVRCLRPYCGRDAFMDPVKVFGEEAKWPAEGLSTRFVCRCGGKAAHVSRVQGRAKPDNPCGWL